MPAGRMWVCQRRAKRLVVVGVLSGARRGQERGRDFSSLNHSNALYMQTFPSAAYIPNLYGSPKKKPVGNLAVCAQCVLTWTTNCPISVSPHFCENLSKSGLNSPPRNDYKLIVPRIENKLLQEAKVYNEKNLIVNFLILELQTRDNK